MKLKLPRKTAKDPAATSPAKPAKTKKAKPLSIWKLGVAAWQELGAGWKGYAKIIAVVIVPLNLLGIMEGVGNDATFIAFSQIIIVIMNVALIWAMIERQRTGVLPKPASAYYDGSIAVVRFLVISGLLLLMAIPAAIAAFMFTQGIAVVEVAGTAVEAVLIGVACLIVAIPSVWMLVRFGLAPVISVATGLRPIAALRYSRRLTLRRYWKVFGRYAGLIPLVVLPALPIAAITALLTFIKLPVLGILFFQFITTFIALPLFNAYLLRLYRSLEELVAAPAAEPATEPETVPTGSQPELALSEQN